MAAAQPSTTLLHAVSHWLRSWSDIALAPATPAADTVAPGALTDPAALTTAALSSGEAPPHWLATTQTSTPPAHWLALLDAHGLTWDADQGIAAQGEPTAEEPAATQADQQEQTTGRAGSTTRPDETAIFREGPSSRQERLPLSSRKMPPDPVAVQDSPTALSVAEALTGMQRTAAHPDANQLDRRQAAGPPSSQPTAPPLVEPPQSYEHGSARPNPPSNPDTPLVAWLTRLHEGVTTLLSAATTAGEAADLPALLRAYAPVAPASSTVATAAHPEAVMPSASAPPPLSTDRAPAPAVVAPPIDGEPAMPTAPTRQPVAPRQNSELSPVTPQRITRLQLRPPGMEQSTHKQPEDRRKDFSLSPKPQERGTPSSGKVIVDDPVDGAQWAPDLPGRLTGQPAPTLTPPPASSSATSVRTQPAVKVTRLRVQAPGAMLTAATAAPAQPAQSTPSPAPPLPITRSLPVDGTPPALVEPARAATIATPVPATPVMEAPVRPVAETAPPSPVDEQATRLARIEALLTRLLAEQSAGSNNAATTPPSPPVRNPVLTPRDPWPALPERSAKAERPPHRRHSDPARRQRLAEEQRGRAWNG